MLITMRIKMLMMTILRQLEMMVEELEAGNEEVLKEAARKEEETRRQVIMMVATMMMMKVVWMVIFMTSRWRPWSSSRGQRGSSLKSKQLRGRS